MKRSMAWLSPLLVVPALAVGGALAGATIGASTVGPVAANATDRTATTSQVTRPQARRIARRVARRVSIRQVNIGLDAVLPITAENLGPIAERSETFQVPATGNVHEVVSCEPQERVISGGSSWDNFPPGNVGLTHVDRRQGQGWRAGGRNLTAAVQPFTVYAYCLQL